MVVLINYLLLSTLVLFCWSGKPLDYTPLLKYLDDDIIRDLTDPIENRGTTFLDYVERFNEGLVHTRDMIDQNIYEAYIKALELQKIGGPQFLKAKFDEELLKRVYKWTDDDITNLKNQFRKTEQLWKEVVDEFVAAEARFKEIQEADAKEKAEMAEREKERVEKLRKKEEELSEKIRLGTT